MAFKDFILSKNYVINSKIIDALCNYNISFNEFVVFIYLFDNAASFSNILDIKNYFNIDEKAVLSAFNTLIEKEIIEIKTHKDDSNKVVEDLSFEKFLNRISDNCKTDDSISTQKKIYSLVSEMLNTTVLSASDKIIIDTWLQKGYTFENISNAIDDAKYNGICTIRYIDKLLYEWESEKNNNTSPSNISIDKIDYNWLDD